MKVLRIVGPSNTGKTTLVERLVERLSDDGRVGTVKHMDCEPDIDTAGKDTSRHRSAGAVRTEGITGDGSWFATGEKRTLTDTLDDLARCCDYALVESYGEADLPTVALGDADVPDPIATAPTAGDVDVDAVVGALEKTDPYETLPSLVAQAKSAPAADRAGVIATVTGRVRTDDPPEEATIREELKARDGVYEALLHHSVVSAGEGVVFVVVLAEHRREAFDALEAGLDRLEEEVPLFTSERFILTDENP